MKKDLINKIILITTGILLLMATIFLIVLSNIRHSDNYVYEGKTFVKNEVTGKNDIKNLKVQIDFINDSEFQITYLLEGKNEEIQKYKYFFIRNKYIKCISEIGGTETIMYIDSFKIRELSLLEEESPDDLIFKNKTNQTLRIVCIIAIICNALIVVGETIYLIFDNIRWKKFLKSKNKKEFYMNI